MLKNWTKYKEENWKTIQTIECVIGIILILTTAIYEYQKSKFSLDLILPCLFIIVALIMIYKSIKEIKNGKKKGVIK